MAGDQGTIATAAASATEADAFARLMDQGRARQDSNDPDGAIAAFAAAVAIAPEDEGALEQLSLALMTARRFSEANAYQARLQAIQARQLPRRLAEGLDDLWRQIDATTLEPATVEWAWELADRSVWEKDAWLRAAAWGSAARRLLRRWWEAAPTPQLGQLSELVEPPDLSALRAAMVGRNACLLVGAHVGPTAAAVHLLRRGNWPFRTLGTADRDRADGDTMVPMLANSITTMRTIVNQIRAGTTVGLMADTPVARDRLALNFLGREVELPLQIPKLARRYAMPSFWCCPLWCSKRIRIELVRLPEPFADEPRDAWGKRWFAAYLEKLEAVMRGRPENLGLFSGIWSNVNPAVLRARQQQAARIHRFAD